MKIKRKRWMDPFYVLLTCTWVISSMALVGCGSGGTLQPEVGEFDELLMRASYAAEAEEGTPVFQEVFAEGATLVDDTTRYGQLRLRLEDDSAGSEPNTRILDVRVLDGSNGQELGTVQWTAVQVGENWRIKDAPLP